MTLGRLAAPFVLMGALLCSPQGECAVTCESFGNDPGWEAVNNIPPEDACQEKTQDFRYRDTSRAGGKPGEIGGWLYRSLTPSYYAAPIEKKTLEDTLKASGRFAVTQSQAGSGVLIGWFNSASRGWRTPNSLAVRIDGEDGKFRVFFEYGTRNWQTGDGTTFEGRYQTTTTPMHPADGTPHQWSFEYHPDGAGGQGEMTFTLDGTVFRAALAEGHKKDGALFDRFGVFNQQISGNGMEIYFDDLSIDGGKLPFDQEPGWEGLNNEVTFLDCAVRPYHDFGYRRSARAGGEPGEIGGIVWRIESMLPQNSLIFGTPVSPLTFDDKVKASGKVAMTLGSADSGLLIGWYNSHTPIGAPPMNFLGIFIEGPSRIGHYFRPALGTSDNGAQVGGSGPVIRADGASHAWTFEYDPAANDGKGRATATLDGASAVLDVSEAARKGNAAFDRFGVLSWLRGGHCAELFFDDLAFTSGTESQR